MRGNDISVKASGEAAAVGQATVGHRSESKAMEWSSTVERKVQDICVETGRRPQGWMGEQEDRPVTSTVCQLVTSTVGTKDGSSLPVCP